MHGRLLDSPRELEFGPRTHLPPHHHFMMIKQIPPHITSFPYLHPHPSLNHTSSENNVESYSKRRLRAIPSPPDRPLAMPPSPSTIVLIVNDAPQPPPPPPRLQTLLPPPLVQSTSPPLLSSRSKKRSPSPSSAPATKSSATSTLSTSSTSRPPATLTIHSAATQ